MKIFEEKMLNEKGVTVLTIIVTPIIIVLMFLLIFISVEFAMSNENLFRRLMIPMITAGVMIMLGLGMIVMVGIGSFMSKTTELVIKDDVLIIKYGTDQLLFDKNEIKDFSILNQVSGLMIELNTFEKKYKYKGGFSIKALKYTFNKNAPKVIDIKDVDDYFKDDYIKINSVLDRTSITVEKYIRDNIF